MSSSSSSIKSTSTSKSDTSTLVSSPPLPPNYPAYTSYGNPTHHEHQPRTTRPQTRWWNHLPSPLSHLHPRLRPDPHPHTHELSKLPPQLSSPAPITCTFHFPPHHHPHSDLFADLSTHRHHLPYPLYLTYPPFASLLHHLSTDLGLATPLIWDHVEQMQVQAGDWEARVRPGWRLGVVFEYECQASSTYYDGDSDSDCDDGYDDDDGEDEDMNSDTYQHSIEKGHTRKPWWFARWRNRVERRKEGAGAGVRKGGRGWVVGVVGMLGIAAAFWVVVLWAARERTRGRISD
ncbi:hypothetical protein K458DRAFT_398633 [Lentithecium fluviatile CBS 122367]|uniref:Uncharacterized protein n=1 Tax=Lentithecium fluviatile CBS 122367 TaxID=1168545 RepID=A0A6G1JK72_9PLEO|nr:hypothetical protein K458DRAFT_398633 [Lentithecium fluviatile CBS 122367]